MAGLETDKTSRTIERVNPAHVVRFLTAETEDRKYWIVRAQLVTGDWVSMFPYHNDKASAEKKIYHLTRAWGS